MRITETPAAVPLPDAPSAIPADPWDMLTFPVESWRDSRFEVFSWDRFPEIIIFDTASFAVQDRFFKRLAFFVEKTGFRGRLAPDAEIAGLHAWNAHDYKAADLAVFFDTARRSGFPLLDEEWEIEAILLKAGILRLDSASQIIPGSGAVLSLSREPSHVSLRQRFLAHEGFHGIFFIDEDFRNFSRQRWEAFPAFARNFLLAYFDNQSYDTTNEYLVVNEFMAHLLQMPVSQASWYFGQHLPNSIATRLPGALPAKEETRDGARFWPELAAVFSVEAEAFSRYVNGRWGLAAGRVWRAR